MKNLIEIGYKSELKDPIGIKLKNEIKDFIGIEGSIITRELYIFKSSHSKKQLEIIAEEIFCDPVIHEYSINKALPALGHDLSVIVYFKSGVTDNIASTIRRTLKEINLYPLQENEEVFSAKKYLFKDIDIADVKKIAENMLYNPLIEDMIIAYSDNKIDIDKKHFSEKKPIVETIDLNISNSDLMKISRSRTLALNLDEMKTIKKYFEDEEFKRMRTDIGMPSNATDVEIEMIAQTWSEHCSHKIFNAEIEYINENGEIEKIHSLFKDYIKKVTKENNKPWLLSVFSDNAGIVKFDEDIALVYKVETHNSPSALDPYGGAMTGIVGVNRDPMGTGLGSELLANVWGYCFADPNFSGNIPNGLMHPNRIREGVHKGVIEGGNQSGIPYMRGFELFDDCYLGKPLVFCGTLGKMPLNIKNKKCYEKEILPGDIIVMTGGRVGKDGIHGATFSSEELNIDSPVQAVQIGDPITQKRMNDVLLEARNRLLYRAITDNGAGGLSSSIGEMALMSGGCELNLHEVPLKYQGLMPWEILVSEAQERMTLAVPEENLSELLELFKKRNVEATAIGKFTDDGYFRAFYEDKPVAMLSLDFLHKGNPGYKLKAKYEKRVFKEPIINIIDHKKTFMHILSGNNIKSREEKCRQYDHEVKGLSVIMPLCGKNSIPSDSSVMMIDHEKSSGVVLSEGINPYYSQIDCYWMAVSVVDIAVRRIIAAGGDPDFISGLDNFCWPSVVNRSLPDTEYKLMQLIRANKGLYDACNYFNIPLISGKDSMSNDSTLFDPPISVLPTLLFSALSKIDNIKSSMSPEFKKEDDIIYIIGKTKAELGASEFYRSLGAENIGNDVPKFGFGIEKKYYMALNKAIKKGLIHSAHALDLGGLAVGIAICAIGGDKGVEISLSSMNIENIVDYELMYSESNGRFIVSVSLDKKDEFEKIMSKYEFYRIGRVIKDRRVIISGKNDKKIVDCGLDNLIEIWKKGIGS